MNIERRTTDILGEFQLFSIKNKLSPHTVIHTSVIYYVYMMAYKVSRILFIYALYLLYI